MTDSDKLKSLDNLLQSGLIGINSGQFILNQTAILSAMAKTDRELLVRILAKVDKLDAGQLLQQTIDQDMRNLTEIMNISEKVVT